MEPLRRLLLWCTALLAIVGALPAAAITFHTATLPAACADDYAADNGTAGTACLNAMSSLAVTLGCNDGFTASHSILFPGYYDPPSWPKPAWSCQVVSSSTITDSYLLVSACAATLNQSISGTVARTGEPSASNPPPQQVCHESCLYGLSSAVAATGLDGSELWSGTWIGEGESCPGTSPPPSPGTGEDGETSEGAAASDATKGADQADASHAALLEDWRLNSIASRSTPSTQSPIGDFFSLPAWVTGIFDPPATDCNLHIDLSGGSSLGFIASAVSSTDVCQVQGIADTYGNWFMWFCAVVWSWAIVVGRSD